LYVANSYNSIILILNTTTNSIVGSITSPVSPWGLSISPNGAYLYASPNQKSDIYVFSTSTNSLIGTIGGFDGTWDSAIAPSGTYGYETNIGNLTVSIFNALAFT
ncbi:MAG: YncE family protein, partial [Candidatus Micrarchaeia archaeon]